ncbi:disulfide bond formation protein B [Haloferax mediterranei ATCC 33500]|uniref:Disulfide bond formation protein B n=1 Tax=Haloferax mediterranei (strain ATCC 33500 / DSM 1411 / JCM 8866 / NBRC 14739 / NCIMB 2177 / R-4) TaxID=523841 RepID=I3R8E4_HALMT|nr:disulfide bond formation protein B [Haloferax mediterranei]AFK20504.1 disulfide bond formation protein DsbB [Haloferax mediterranei ATCC 33500]AHZ23863.1 disulfide bond formation protein DsbB [Haloferax mediterranei ATCC 33500]ELZ98287.1 disulfide bond formation protein DsbB [Haloferax mediterranei ATCC 33500]MDX5986740.1 disulfide bond formation protein B [Haloferax mediterranei ATCC 33500]QCQ76064.1 disulfide bond formation protein B [Haloferax mediterranei ATCC 33500]
MSDTTRALLTVGTLVALAATTGSLYFSLGLGLTPCDLCWYQRILMYPLVVVLGVAAVEDRADVWKTILPLSLGGVALAGYHTYLQVAPGATCTVGGPCTSIQYPMLGGLLTIPRLSLIAFSLVTLLSVAVARAGGTDDAWGI